VLAAHSEGRTVRVRNTGATALSRLTVTIVSATGSRHVARPPETLGAGEDLYLALDEFLPTPPPGLKAAVVSATSD
jgi:hypothetical protein